MRIAAATIAGFVLPFVVGWSAMPVDTFIIVLNGLFVGTYLALSLVFGELLYRAVTGKGRADVRLTTIGFMIQQTGFALSVLISIYLRAADSTVNDLAIIAFARWCVIYGALVVIFAPGAELRYSFWQGRDRKVTLAAVAAGVVAAVVSIFVQDQQVLALLCSICASV